MCRMLAAIMTCGCICVAFILLSSMTGVASVESGSGSAQGTPLPDRCYGPRGDRTLSRTCANSDTNKVPRFVFHGTKHCKKFRLCQEIATYLDEEGGPSINYFQDRADCEKACTNVVECCREPLQISNGSPGTDTEEGVWAELGADQRLGFGTMVTFRCAEGYRLPEGVWNRTCELNGTWSGTTPTCNIQCPKPEVRTGYTVSPQRNFYNVGDRIQVDCMDSYEGSTPRWTCLQNGSWEGAFPECSPSCSPPPVDNARPPMIETRGPSSRYTYTCLNGYTLFNDSSDSLTLSCTNGVLEGKVPVCTRVEISSSSGSVTEDRGTYYYELEKGSQDRDLTCGLEGVDQVLYQAEWTLPTKPNGEGPPEVEDEGNRIVFRTAYPAQNGEYICHICNANISVFVNVTQSTGEHRRPTVSFSPNGTIKRLSGQDILLSALITGTQPLKVVWQHNGSNISSSSERYELMEYPAGDAVLSTLLIRGFGESAQGTYQIVVNNSGGWTISMQKAMLMLKEETDSGRSGRSTRRSVFCQDPGKAVLSGVVRRLGRTKSGLQSITLRVKRVLRGNGSVMVEDGDKVEVRIFSGADTTRLHRGQAVILSGVPVEERRRKLVYMFDTPIENYSAETERAIGEC